MIINVAEHWQFRKKREAEFIRFLDLFVALYTASRLKYNAADFNVSSAPKLIITIIIVTL